MKCPHVRACFCVCVFFVGLLVIGWLQINMHARTRDIRHGLMAAFIVVRCEARALERARFMMRLPQTECRRLVAGRVVAVVAVRRSALLHSGIFAR